MIDRIERALRSVAHPRFFETERGFQGEFSAQLRALLPAATREADPVLEQEHQKRPARHHHLRVRPDLIYHVPTPRAGDVRVGNRLVIEIKRRATRSQARKDLAKLNQLIDTLRYSVGVFINVDRARTHADQYAGPHAGRIHCFAVRLNAAGEVEVIYERPQRSVPSPAAPPRARGRRQRARAAR